MHSNGIKLNGIRLQDFARSAATDTVTCTDLLKLAQTDWLSQLPASLIDVPYSDPPSIDLSLPSTLSTLADVFSEPLRSGRYLLPSLNVESYSFAPVFSALPEPPRIEWARQQPSESHDVSTQWSETVPLVQQAFVREIIRHRLTRAQIHRAGSVIWTYVWCAITVWGIAPGAQWVSTVVSNAVSMVLYMTTQHIEDTLAEVAMTASECYENRTDSQTSATYMKIPALEAIVSRVTTATPTKVAA